MADRESAATFKILSGKGLESFSNVFIRTKPKRKIGEQVDGKMTKFADIKRTNTLTI